MKPEDFEARAREIWDRAIDEGSCFTDIIAAFGRECFDAGLERAAEICAKKAEFIRGEAQIISRSGDAEAAFNARCSARDLNYVATDIRAEKGKV